MKNGFLLIDKPKDWTSFDVCNKAKRGINNKRVGHTGTLDPFATGLLVVATGKTTKLIPFFEKSEKTYLAEIWLGRTSETLDPESEIIISNKKIKNFNLSELQAKIEQEFLGEIEQVPPKYSALKQDGKRLYQLAREGKEVNIPSRKTHISSLTVLNQSGYKLQIELTVQAGFYVRSFARDLSQFLGLGAGMCGELRRTRVGDLEVSDSISVEKIDPVNLISPEKIINFPTITINDQRTEDFTHGRAFDGGELPTGSNFFVKNKDTLLGLGIRNNRDWIQPKIKLIQ